jgi:hypothetical protein
VSDRTLRLIIFEPIRRPFRRGYWARWELEIVWAQEDGIEWSERLNLGWLKRYKKAPYASFEFGSETEVSRTMLAWSLGLEGAETGSTGIRPD